MFITRRHQNGDEKGVSSFYNKCNSKKKELAGQWAIRTAGADGVVLFGTSLVQYNPSEISNKKGESSEVLSRLPKYYKHTPY